MLERILTDQQEVLLAEERGCLRQLQTALARFEASREDQAALERSVRQLDELFLLVVVGEFNSGKSTFINALLGTRLLAEGVTPTTRRIHRLGFGPEEARGVAADGLEEIAAPVELLRHVQIVDTPGTNALDREHETLTREFVPRSDLVLFVTSADRPFTESERVFIESIRQWGKKLVLVVNKIDILGGEADRKEIESFIVERAARLLGFEPEVFSVSSRKALEAKLDGGDPALLAASRFAALERYLVETLDQQERVRLKLLNPLGVAARLTETYLGVADERAGILQEDFKALEDIDAQLALFQEDMGREFRFRLADVDNQLHEFEKRGLEFFDENLRLARAFDLLNKARMKADFERRVIADAPQKIEARVDEIIDWMVEAELRQWQAVSEHLARRRSHHAEGLVGELGRFEYNRKQLLETVGRAAQRAVQDFDQRVEAARMAESVQAAVAGTALVEVGAIGLGALFTVLATTQVMDLTGILAASTVAILGLFILPARRRKAKRQLSERILELRDQLMTSITGQFEREIERGAQRIQEAISPYTRFVRAERGRLREMRDTLGESRDLLARLREMVEAL